jgi:phage repressor protein C with HTH and peptisase S24 domain
MEEASSILGQLLQALGGQHLIKALQRQTNKRITVLQSCNTYYAISQKQYRAILLTRD